jgi:RNA polymerase sigma-70 factor (sigma-E family)
MDAEAVSAAADRSETSLDDLYARHASSAGRLAYLLTGDRAAAEELVQEAFVRLVGRFRHRRVPDAFDAYLRRAIVNLHTSQLRRVRLERRELERARTSAAAVPATLPDLESRDEIWRALLELPRRQRAVVVLRFYEDLSERQTAEVMRTSTNSVKSLLARAMRTLRERIGSEIDDPA